MQLYMSWYIISFFRLYLYFLKKNVLYLFKYSCTNIFHKRNLILSIEIMIEIMIIEMAHDKTDLDIY